MNPRAVLMKTGLKPLNTVRPVNTAHPKNTVYRARSMSCFSKLAQSTVHPQKEDQGYVDSRCSRHMPGNIGRYIKIPQSSGPPEKVGDKAVHKELGDRMERAATTASSLEVEQDSGNINRT
ncbi:hypothetical protein Tco_0023232 [Tanacetum coccineum]